MIEGLMKGYLNFNIFPLKTFYLVSEEETLEEIAWHSGDVTHVFLAFVSCDSSNPQLKERMQRYIKVHQKRPL